MKPAKRWSFFARHVGETVCTDQQEKPQIMSDEISTKRRQLGLSRYPSTYSAFTAIVLVCGRLYISVCVFPRLSSAVICSQLAFQAQAGSRQKTHVDIRLPRSDVRLLVGAQYVEDTLISSSTPSVGQTLWNSRLPWPFCGTDICALSVVSFVLSNEEDSRARATPG